MRPDLLLRYLRKKQIKDNKKRFEQKNLQFSVDSLYDLNYMGDSNPDHNLDIHSPQNTVGELPVLLVIHGVVIPSVKNLLTTHTVKFLQRKDTVSLI